MWSHRLSTRFMSWSTSRTVVPASRTSRSRSASQALSEESSPAAGSSSSTTSGLATSARAIDTSWRCPCESSPAGRSRNASSPNNSNSARDIVAAALSIAPGPHEDVLGHRQLVPQLDALERAPETLSYASIRRQIIERRSVERNGATAAAESGDRVDHARLARAVRTDQADDGVAVDVEAHAVDRDDTAVSNREVAHGERDTGLPRRSNARAGAGAAPPRGRVSPAVLASWATPTFEQAMDVADDPVGVRDHAHDERYAGEDRVPVDVERDPLRARVRHDSAGGEHSGERAARYRRDAGDVDDWRRRRGRAARRTSPTSRCRGGRRTSSRRGRR